ncbi:MAG: MFS transporter [Brevundimonas sp.]|uniref:MFS transporter n=1 Tax=Brevundimonas sp. TaxID=1871086 RepID=UPI00273656D1|nr:MFS transporter [Brevundimonas sp.]MDP3403452.1 MFS transporter [Brevundimonas sp.]
MNTTLVLCFVSAVIEGIDIISFGLAAADLRSALGLDTRQIALAASANMAAFILGALVAGRVSDRIGRKWVLVAAMGLIGLFSLATALATSFEWLLGARALTGVGLGAAMPMFIALASEAGEPEGRVSRVSAMLSGSPLGGILASLFVASAWGANWQAIFLLGGISPLLLIPFLAKFITETRDPEPITGHTGNPRPSPLTSLFANGRWVLTLLLWVGLLSNQVLTYIMFNWLPVLLRDLGFERWQASMAMTTFMAAAVIGNVAISRFLTGAGRWIVVAGVFAGVVASLLAFGLPGLSFVGIAIVSGSAGLFILSATVLLYGLATDIYPTSVRGTGVGSATAVGRLGAIGGPLLAGGLLQLGVVTGTLLPILAPFAVLGGAAAVYLARKVR